MICGSCWCSLRIFVTPGRNSWEAAFFHPFPPFFPLVWWTYTNSTISGKVISVKNISTWVICILMAKPQISRRVSFKSFQWWERLNHTTSLKKNTSAVRLCAAFFSPFFWGDLQRRLRRLVIFCLSCVDLQDEKLSVVLDYLKELLQGLDDERRPLAERHWYRLHSRVYDVYGYGDGLCDCDWLVTTVGGFKMCQFFHFFPTSYI